MHLNRRQLLKASVVAGAGAALGGGSRLLTPAAEAASTLPAPDDSGIDHVVVVMMENRSFDHFLGWLPGADGEQAGLSYVDRYGLSHQTHHLTAYSSCGYNDPDHSWEGGRIELDGGACDGWLKAGLNDELAIGYYGQDDLGFLGRAAPAWTVCDRYFSAVMAETYPNRLYQHAAQTDRLHNSTDKCTLPTIWDRLADAGLSGKYYFGDVPFTALWYDKYLDISAPYSAFLADAAAGQLPAVSFVDPRFEDEPSGTSADDHPHADIRAGETFLAQVYDAVTSSPSWKNTLLVVNYDEWGGFFDHVAPSTAPDVSNATALRGFRVPALVVSPRARRGHVAHGTYDHTSILRTIEWRWGLPALTPRDAAARNLAEVLDFDNPPDTSAATITVPPYTPVPPCEVSDAAGPEATEWSDLKSLALSLGWSLPS
ncbi:MAG TPA: alkaline phosphatase family protein [Marmoricola sp.]|nr:alkaline phosphatase family protein [Marmoricola sp.]